MDSDASCSTTVSRNGDCSRQPGRARPSYWSRRSSCSNGLRPDWPTLRNGAGGADGTVAVDGVWKRFRADRRDRHMSAHVNRLGRRLRGDSSAWQWALQDVSLAAEPGEAVGLIGTNGSGKTTLLRLMNRVMYPYAGRVSVHGRVGALIEIRAGLHPELRGSENVYFFGSLLGLRRSEITAHFDDIV